MNRAFPTYNFTFSEEGNDTASCPSCHQYHFLARLVKLTYCCQRTACVDCWHQWYSENYKCIGCGKDTYEVDETTGTIIPVLESKKKPKTLMEIPNLNSSAWPDFMTLQFACY